MSTLPSIENPPPFLQENLEPLRPPPLPSPLSTIFSKVPTSLPIRRAILWKVFTNHKKKTNRTVDVSHRPPPNKIPSDKYWRAIPSDKYLRVQLMCIKVQAHTFWTTTGTQLGTPAFSKSRLVITFLINLGVTWILCSFRLILEGKAGKEILESSRFEFLKKSFFQTLLLYQ